MTYSTQKLALTNRDVNIRDIDAATAANDETDVTVKHSKDKSKR